MVAPSDPITADNHGAWVTVVAGILLAWMICVYVTRVYIRLRFSPWGSDDSVITFGTIIAICQVAAICQAVRWGFGKRSRLLDADQFEAVEKALFASQVLYIATLGASKCATAFLINRLTRTRSHQLASSIVIGITTLWSVIAIFVISLRGDLRHPWRCWDEPGSGLFARWMGIEVVGMLLEVAIVALATTLVCFLQMTVKLKVLVVSAFACRALVIIPAIVRLYYLRPSFNAPDPTFNNVYAVIVTQVAMHYGLIAASIPCLKPFIRPFDAGYVGDDSDSTTYSSVHPPNMFPAKRRRSTTGTNDHAIRSTSSGGKKSITAAASALARLSSKSSNRNLTVVSSEPWTNARVHRHHTPEELALRPDVGEVITVVEHSAHGSRSGRDMEMGMAGDAYGEDRMVIRQTKEYEVQIEKADAAAFDETDDWNLKG